MKVVLFDIDHTLMASPAGANSRSSQRTFIEKFGIDVSEDSVEKVGMTEWGIIEKIVAEYGSKKYTVEQIRQKVPDGVYQYWAQALEEESKNSVSEIGPGMLELVTALMDEKDVKLGLLTGNSYWRSEVKLQSIGLDEFFRGHDGKLIGAFGNEARTREGLMAFAQDRHVYNNDSLTLIDDSLIGAHMVKGRREVYAIFVATGAATKEQLMYSERPVFEDLGEERWKEAFELILKNG